MNKFLELFLRLFTFLPPLKQKVKDTPKPTPKPTPKIVEGMFDMKLHAKDLVNKLFDNPMIIGALKGTVDLGKGLNLGFPCILHMNTNQKISWVLVDNGFRIDFNDTHPLLEAEKFFSVEVDIDFIFIDRKHARISLVGIPDLIVNFV